jgi:hypothetical protein
MQKRMVGMLFVSMALTLAGTGCGRKSGNDTAKAAPAPERNGGLPTPQFTEAMRTLKDVKTRPPGMGAAIMEQISLLYDTKERALAVAKANAMRKTGAFEKRHSSIQYVMTQPTTPAIIAESGCFAMLKSGVPRVAMNTRVVDYQSSTQKPPHIYTDEQLAEITPFAMRLSAVAEVLIDSKLPALIMYSDSYRDAVTEAILLEDLYEYEHRVVGPFMLVLHKYEGTTYVVAAELDPYAVVAAGGLGGMAEVY